MDELLRTFEEPVRDKTGTSYSVLLYGRNRPGDTWQGWLVFERASDGERFATDVETTQPDADAIVYWASGLTRAYFDGALDRAQRARPHDPTPLPAPEPIIGDGRSTASRRERLADLERAVLACFVARGVNRLLTRDVFDALPNANADIVRALEDLEKQGRMLVRRTEEGNDWVALTEAGVAASTLTP